jgi:hypothetical protein
MDSRYGIVRQVVDLCSWPWSILSCMNPWTMQMLLPREKEAKAKNANSRQQTDQATQQLATPGLTLHSSPSPSRSLSHMAHTQHSDAIPMRSHHSLTRREIFQNLANRIIYSKFYMVLYIVMAILSLWSIFLSFHQGCASSSLFVVLEVIINCTMIAEVALRLTALGRVTKISKFRMRLLNTWINDRIT